jgi:hypothetical protein
LKFWTQTGISSANVNAVNGAATYSHAMRAGGAVSLLVRAVRLETTKSGTFFTHRWL